VEVARLKIENFRGIKNATLDFSGHALLVGRNNVGKSTICEALELALGPDRQARFPIAEEFDFYNAQYLSATEEPIPIKIEVTLTKLTDVVQKACGNHVERWDPKARAVLVKGELEKVDKDNREWCLRLLTIARYNKEEDEFEASTYYAKAYDPNAEDESRVSRQVRRTFGFLYLRTLRTGSRALSLERGSLLDIVLRLQSLQAGIWEKIRGRLENLNPPIDDGAAGLGPVLQSIEHRLADYIQMEKPGESTRLFVSELTREHLRKTLNFFVKLTEDQKPVPFHEVGTGTLNTLVLALLTFIAELRKENVIFAMEEPEIALPPHTQRRIASYLVRNAAQCLVTSHSPYVIECFDPDQIILLTRDTNATVSGKTLAVNDAIKAKTYRRFVRRGLAEAILGRGAIVVEGISEQWGLQSVAERMEKANPEKHYPLDLSGVTIFCADGDGSIGDFGKFFASLGLKIFAFLDQKKRHKTEEANINAAGFTILCQTQYKGIEKLLATEIPLRHQWTYLEQLREAEISYVVPAQRPNDEALRELTYNVLADGKGWGRAAELLDLCAVDELPTTITEFLKGVYALFTRPVPPQGTNSANPNVPPEDLGSASGAG
jgi:putative ATP-dependent endonuclease of the OLD family